MDAEWISFAAGVLLSIVFTITPKLNVMYAALSEDRKKLIMIGSLAVVALAIYGLACANLLQDLTGWTVTCDKAGAIVVFKVFAAAATGNQITHRLLPTPKAVKAVKVRG